MLIGMAATSCVSDDTESPVSTGEATVGITITAAPLGSSTRGFEDSEKGEEPAQSNELINNWMVVVVQGNKIVDIIDKTVGNTQGVWNDQIQRQLAPGTYTFIAFANVDTSNLNYRIGDPLANDWKDRIAKQDDLKAISDGRSNIPMSGYLENVTVKTTINEEFSIEVVRMLCKVQFAFKNESKENTVTINQIELKPVYNGDIYLFPDYSAYGGLGRPNPNLQAPEKEPRFPEPTEENKAKLYITQSISSELTLKPGQVTSVDKNELPRSTFYIKESVAKGNHSTNRFHIALTLTRKNNKQEETKENVSYALAAEDLKFFYRNDYVLFPIVISDYTPEIEVYDYPPIGGYPVKVTSNGNEFYATFSSSGAFDIVTHIRNSDGTMRILPERKKEVDDSEKGDFVQLASITGDLTMKEPVYYPNEGAWRGDFPQGTGKNIVITFRFRIDGLIYTRTLYLLS